MEAAPGVREISFLPVFCPTRKNTYVNSVYFELFLVDQNSYCISGTGNQIHPFLTRILFLDNHTIFLIQLEDMRQHICTAFLLISVSQRTSKVSTRPVSEAVRVAMQPTQFWILDHLKGEL